MSDDLDDLTDPADATLLDPATDSAITALLTALPDVDMPSDVADRIGAALASEVPLSGPVPAWAADGSDNVTVLPSPAQRQRKPHRGLRVLGGVAAGVVAVFGLVLVGTQVVSNRTDSGAGGATAAGAQTPSTQTPSNGADLAEQGTLLTASGTTYSEASLPTQVAGLVRAAQTPGAPRTKLDAVDPAESPEVAPGTQYTAQTLVTLVPVLDVCLDKLAAQDDPPIAADAGSWVTKPAVVLVLPGSQSGRVDVYVVAPGCGDASDTDDPTLYFASVATP